MASSPTIQLKIVHTACLSESASALTMALTIQVVLICLARPGLPSPLPLTAHRGPPLVLVSSASAKSDGNDDNSAVLGLIGTFRTSTRSAQPALSAYGLGFGLRGRMRPILRLFRELSSPTLPHEQHCLLSNQGSHTTNIAQTGKPK